MPIVQATGITTNYEQVGKGPVLLLLHGWANSWEAWLPIIPLLSDHFTLILPDLPGCGKSETPKEGWSTAQHARWLNDVIGKLEIENFSILGHSYGGKILLEYCSGNYQPQPQKLVLIDSSGIPNVLNRKQKLLQKLSLLTPKVFKNRVGTALRGKLYSSFGADSDYVWANSFQKKTLQIILQEEYTNKLASIAQPTLILWGKQDTATPLWQGETMHTLIPLNQWKTFESNHFPHHEYPEQVSTTICQFL